MTQTIASWGTAGAGKTTVCLALAAALTKQKKDVLILSLDQQTPMLPVYLPDSKLSHSNSLGSLLDNPTGFAEADFRGRIHRHPKSDHLFFAGLVAGETIGLTYKPPTRQRIELMMQYVRKMPFAYVIVDCQTNPIFDALTFHALERAQYILRTCTPDVRGFESLQAQLGWMQNNADLRTDQHIRIAGMVQPTTPMSDAASTFGGFDYTLPFALEVHDRYAAGLLLTHFTEPTALAFEEQITRLSRAVGQEVQSIA